MSSSDDEPVLEGGGIYPASRELWQPELDPKKASRADRGDPFDGRPKGEWRSRYPAAIHKAIVHELAYLGACLVLGFMLAAGAVAQLKGVSVSGLPTVSEATARIFGSGLLAFGSGMLGGTLFSAKWLYHAVAKGIWSLDRRIWRIATPLISAVLATAVLALLQSDVLHLFNATVVARPAGIFGVCFLAGYFSDVTVAKLNELAEVIFAPGRSSKGSSPYSDDGKPNSSPPDSGLPPDQKKPSDGGTKNA